MDYQKFYKVMIVPSKISQHCKSKYFIEEDLNIKIYLSFFWFVELFFPWVTYRWIHVSTDGQVLVFRKIINAIQMLSLCKLKQILSLI